MWIENFLSASFQQSFSLLRLAHQPFAKSMPIISARGIITPATYWRNFYEGRRARKGWDNNKFTALVSLTVPKQIPLHLLCLQLLKVAGIQIKIISMILTQAHVHTLLVMERDTPSRPNCWLWILINSHFHTAGGGNVYCTYTLKINAVMSVWYRHLTSSHQSQSGIGIPASGPVGYSWSRISPALPSYEKKDLLMQC